MSQFAQAINEHLGVAKPAPVAPKPVKPVSYTRERSGDVGAIHVSEHQGIAFIVREFGAVSFMQDPGVYGFWSTFFTDEELHQERAKGNVEGRAQACRNAIDRYLSDAPVWRGPWWSRGMTL
jgi:hypothetical protein